MKYSEIINKIKELSLNHGLVESFKFGDNILIENNNTYPLIYLTPQKIITGNPMNTYSFTLFYVDLGDSMYSIDNGVRALEDTFRALDLIHTIDVTKGEFTVFNHKFSDLCTGLFCDLTVKAYSEYNENNKIIK